MTRKGQQSEELMDKKVSFKAKISHMGEKYLIVIPMAYHHDIDRKDWKGDYLHVVLTKDACVKFNKKLAHMGEKYILTIPAAYHDDIDSQKWVGKYVNVDLIEEE